MAFLLTGSYNSYLQLISVLIIFIVVLGATAYTTRWIANYQKKQKAGSNIEILETASIGSGKYIQLVRIGDTYLAIAVCKDTVTQLCQLSKEEISFDMTAPKQADFKSLLNKLTGREKDPKDTSGE